MLQSFKYTSPPVPFVSLREAKDNLVVQHAADDALIERLVLGASQFCERFCGQTFAARTARFRWRAHPAGDCPLEIPHGPVLQAVGFDPGDGTAPRVLPADVLAGGWELWADHQPPLLYPPGGGWPALADGGRPYLDLKLGWGDGPDKVPDEVKNAVQLIVAHRYYKRGDQARLGEDADVPGAAKQMLYLYWSGRYV